MLVWVVLFWVVLRPALAVGVEDIKREIKIFQSIFDHHRTS